MRILTLIDCYVPGFKHGGPIRTIANLVAQMPPEFEFWILTSDRDRGDRAPYVGVPLDGWTQRGHANVYYSQHTARVSLLRTAVREARPDVVYANSLFSRTTTCALLARKLGLIPRIPFIIAPRGELAPSALGLKKWKKAPYLAMGTRAGLWKDVLWQASSALERSQIQASLPGRGGHPDGAIAPAIAVAPDLAAEPLGPFVPPAVKTAGHARFVFISRITAMKNLPFAIDRLASLSGDVELDIFGPKDDAVSWTACERAIAALPANVRVRYKGLLAPEEVQPTFGQYDFAILPSLGENFGHVISEALGAGCPVVLSDRTPWTTWMGAGAGWALPLESPELWVAALQTCVDMAADEHSGMRVHAERAARKFVETNPIQASMEMFRRAVADRPPSMDSP